MSGSRRLALVTLLVAFALALLPGERTALAQPPSAALLARLAVQAAQLERMRTHASFTVEGRLESLDGDGTVASLKEGKARVQADGKAAHVDVLRYVEDGKDETAEAREKVRDGAKKPKDQDKRPIRMPFHAGEQPRYVFDVVKVDPADPTRVLVSFVPKIREDDTIEGSAWVDTRAGTVLSAGFKLSRTPAFVDYVHVTVVFGAKTSLGPAISKVTVEGKGGVLFFHKHFVGEATLSDYRIVG